MEDLKRVPTAQTDIQIVPTAQLGESDIVVSWQQRTVPFRLTLSADDSGSKSTGRYQGNVTFSADNPLGLSDLFYVSYGRALGHVPSQKGTDERTEKGASQNFTLHYSVPFGNWLWSFNHQNYRYHQAVSGNYTVYDYNGKSRSSDLSLSRLLYRDAKRKTHMGFKLWQRENRSYIDDAEIEVQRRKTAGWAASLSHKEYWGRATLDAQINYKRGTGMQDALPAPEEVFNEGTSRMKIWTADIGLNLPMGKQGKWTLDSRWHGQWNKTLLTPLDRLAIGGRYTVRGFDGEMSLSAERGWYWRNELAWQYRAGHQIYATLDAGYVAGASAQYLVGKNLMGAAIGVRGQFQKGLSYDVFAAKPIHKPQYFATANKVYGFNVSWTF
ncbi:ShlB/FhaC/HecB family hemolysin secretion/activation protein [Kingella negevensis]|nr:ShlB/FhaC/HecB family hemolysin secretion/activation protein [Kingella negevensis]WII93640.1 ShlB/FhaC/HecB family hemolysin secretion/activation protein [Kingella negevensis]